MRPISAIAVLLISLMAAACRESDPAEQPDKPSANRIVGSWVIDKAAQRKEVARISPGELASFDEAFRTNFGSIREIFHSDGRYEVTNPLGGPFDDRWEIVSESATSVTIRSLGHTWVARRAAMGANTHDRSVTVLTYTFSDRDHMFVTTRMPLFGVEKEVSYYFVRDE